ncbi:MAG: peptidoglycan DD-metalloendopeptidase family protein [Deltaproteobacteria bacterium]|nr:peptidoglycan DD-metalloendopeptidase family protein [Deltaproteobacteria bacterium]
MRAVAFVLATLCLSSRASSAAELTVLLEKERASLAALDQLAQQVTSRRAALEELRQQEELVRYQLAEGVRKMTALASRLDERRQLLQKRLRTLYRLSRGGSLRLLVEASGAGDVFQRATIFSRLVSQDVEELRTYRRELALLAAERKQLVEQQARRTVLVAQLERERTGLEAAEQEQKRLLAKVRRSRRLRQALLGQLGARERALLDTIQRLGYRLLGRSSLFAQKGRLPRPVAGPIAGRFGQAVDRESGLSALQSGLIFRPASRAPVRAVAAGTVRVTQPMAGLGQLVVLEHPGRYYTVYGLLGHVQVKPGAHVDEGWTLGLAGTDPLSGLPAAYFELREGQRALDPSPWLAAR